MRSPSLSSATRGGGGCGSRHGGGGGGLGGKKAEAMLCCSKEAGLKRGPWTAEEDRLLAEYVKREGEGRWRTLPKKAGLLRCGKSCRLRWMNYLRPSIKRGHISPDEEDLILRLHRLLGNRWSLIAGRIPGRTDNEIKNYWNTHLRKKLISQGIDPKTHKSLVINPNHHPSINHDHNKKLIFKNSSSATNDHDPVNPNHDHVPFALEKPHDHQGITNEDGDNNDDYDDDEDTMINKCCRDDAFSSFLNSLINDDMFNHHHHHQEQDQHDHSSS